MHKSRSNIFDFPYLSLEIYKENINYVMCVCQIKARLIDGGNFLSPNYASKDDSESLSEDRLLGQSLYVLKACIITQKTLTDNAFYSDYG